MATKSGSNDFHGTVFEFFRNEALNARNYFAPPGPKPEFRRNQYGFTLGGPIQKNKTFFFVDYQGTNLANGHHAHQHRSDAGTAERQVLDGCLQSLCPDPAASLPTTRFPPASSTRLRFRFWHVTRCRTCPARQITTHGRR